MQTSSRRRPFPLPSALLLTVLMAGLADSPGAAQAGRSDGAEGEVLRLLTAAEAARYRAHLAQQKTTGGAPDELVVEGLDEPARQFLVPRFRVDARNLGGSTTLFAARNPVAEDTTIQVSYFDDTGRSQVTETFFLEAFSVVSRNVRDVPGLAQGPGALKTGYLLVTGPVGSSFSVDVFQVDPDQDFATGSRAVDTTRPHLCQLWDIRYLQGGLFSGGTTLTLYLNRPLGAEAADPSAVFEVFDEDGRPFGLVGLFTGRRSLTVRGQDILAAAEPRVPSFGGFQVRFDRQVFGGHVEAVYDADGRFSVGLRASCVTQ